MRKASHTLIAGILLLLVVVGTGIILYTHTASIEGDVKGSKAGANPIFIEHYMQSGTCGYVFIRNIGSDTIVMEKPTLYIYKGDNLVYRTEHPWRVTIEPKQLKIICFDLTEFLADESNSGTYRIKVSSTQASSDIRLNVLIKVTTNPPPTKKCMLNTTYNTVYYDIEGDGDIDGNTTTITEALQNVNKGGKIYVLPGIYTEDIKINKGVEIKAAGCGNEWRINGTVRIRLPDSTHTVIFKGFHIEPEKTGMSRVVWIEGPGNIIFENNRIRYVDSPMSDNYPAIVWIEDTTGRLTFKDNTIIANYPFTCNGFPSQIKIFLGNGEIHIVNNNFTGYGTGYGDSKIHGINYIYSDANLYILNNYMKNLELAIGIRAGSNITIKNNLIEKCKNAIYFGKWENEYEVYNVAILNNKIIDTRGHGIYFNRGLSIKNIEVSKNDMTGTMGSHYGIHLEGSSIFYNENIKVKNNHIEGYSAEGIFVSKVKDALIKDNNITSTGDSISINAVGEAIIENNIVKDARNYGVRVHGCTNCNYTLIKDNYFEGRENTSDAGIYIEYESKNITITNNVIKDFAEYGGLYYKTPGGLSTPIINVMNNKFINNGIDHRFFRTTWAQIKIWLESSSLDVSQIKINDNEIIFKDVTPTNFVYIYDKNGLTNGNPLDMTNNKWLINGTEINDRNTFKNYVCDHENPCDTYTSSYGGYITTGFYTTT